MATDRNRQVYRKSNIFGVIIIAVICLVIGAAAYFAGRKIDAQNDYYTQQENELQSQIDAENERTKEIEDYSRYVLSDEFAEKEAREKFGLVTDDEIVLKSGDGE